MGASLTCGKWSEPPRSGYNTLFDQNLLCYEEGILYYYRSSTETITQTDWLCHEIYSKQTMGATFNLPLKTLKESTNNKVNTNGSTDGQIGGRLKRIAIVGFEKHVS